MKTGSLEEANALINCYKNKYVEEKTKRCLCKGTAIGLPVPPDPNWRVHRAISVPKKQHQTMALEGG